MRRVFLKNPRDVKKLLCIIVRDVREGRIQPAVANSAIYGLNSLLKVMETTDFERRLSDIEKIIAMKDLTPYRIALSRPNKTGGTNDG
jgi:hypothetical protein